MDHLRDSGFAVRTHDVDDLRPVKTRHRVPGSLESCHTALVDGYVIEGHVPADAIRRLLAERRGIAGLAVPGMPIGSPGMEVPGQPPQRYQIMSFDGRGQTAVFERR